MTRIDARPGAGTAMRARVLTVASFGRLPRGRASTMTAMATPGTAIVAGAFPQPDPDVPDVEPSLASTFADGPDTGPRNVDAALCVEPCGSP